MTRSFLQSILTILLKLNIFTTIWLNPPPPPQSYQAIFSFGDSIADTGNFIRSGAVAFPVGGDPPYGETFFNHPTGRCSDGRLIVDFFAEAFGLPNLPPYLSLVEGQNIRQGVNLAVTGATALDIKFFEDREIGQFVWTNMSLSVQVGWFQKIKSSLCSTEVDCESYFRKALFLVGEIGGNDYNVPFLLGGSIKQLQDMTPLVVEAIVRATSVLIKEGAMNLVIPGNFPIGCLTSYLTLFQSSDKTKYDEQNQCLKAYNEFSEYHNTQLKNALVKLRQKYPHTKIIYADYYHATLRLFNSPEQFGFTNVVVRTCCGGGGPYNYNVSAICGHIGSNSCRDPSSYVNWDGIHMTEAAYKLIAQGLIEGPYSSPPL